MRSASAFTGNPPSAACASMTMRSAPSIGRLSFTSRLRLPAASFTFQPSTESPDTESTSPGPSSVRSRLGEFPLEHAQVQHGHLPQQSAADAHIGGFRAGEEQACHPPPCPSRAMPSPRCRWPGGIRAIGSRSTPAPPRASCRTPRRFRRPSILTGTTTPAGRVNASCRQSPLRRDRHIEGHVHWKLAGALGHEIVNPCVALFPQGHMPAIAGNTVRQRRATG